MRASVVTKSLTAASANAIAVSQTVGGATSIVLTANPVVLDTQRRVIITSAGNDSADLFVVTGTNEGGAPIKDSFFGANIGVAQSNLDFATVTAVFTTNATAGAIQVGTNTVGSSPWKLFADSIATPNLGIDMQLAPGGTGNATFEYTDNPFLLPIGVQSAVALGGNSPNPSAIAHPDLQALTASKDGALNWPIHGWRLTINSGISAWTCTVRQAGLASP